MGAAPVHPREEERLRALRSYEILDTDPEPTFDDVTRLAARVCHTPIALVSLVDEDRQWFKSRENFGATQTPRRQAICAHAILQEEVLVVPDTLADPRFCDNDLCTGAPNLRFYAGARLTTTDGLPLGTLCVLDTEPRDLDPVQRDSLRILANQVMRQLDYRRTLKRQQIILREGAHRAKNALSVTQALARLSRQHASSLEEFAEEFEPRLAALAEAQTLLAEGMQNAVDVRSLVERQTRGFVGAERDQLAIAGPNAMLTGAGAEGLGLALHELSTNAVKHGAWSVPEGQVEITWAPDGQPGMLRFRWTERGGPAPSSKEREGFGSRLLEQIAPAMLQGSASLDLGPDGAVWDALIALRAAEEARAS